MVNVQVKGVKVKLLDLSMIRRYNSPTPLLDPSVAKILVGKGYAVFYEEKERQNLKIENKLEEEITIFPKEIINEDL